MPGKCSFNACWLTKTEYKSWLREVKGDLYKVFCVVCKKTMNLTSMGESALRSHSSGTKHQASMKLDRSTAGQATMKTYLEQKQSESQMKSPLVTQMPRDLTKMLQ